MTVPVKMGEDIRNLIVDQLSLEKRLPVMCAHMKHGGLLAIL